MCDENGEFEDSPIKENSKAIEHLSPEARALAGRASKQFQQMVYMVAQKRVYIIEQGLAESKVKDLIAFELQLEEAGERRKVFYSPSLDQLYSLQTVSNPANSMFVGPQVFTSQKVFLLTKFSAILFVLALMPPKTQQQSFLQILEHSLTKYTVIESFDFSQEFEDCSTPVMSKQVLMGMLSGSKSI